MGERGTERLILRRLQAQRLLGLEPTPKPRRTAREASASKRVPTVHEEDSWEASPQHPVTDRHRRRRSASVAVTQARWASPASDLTDSPSAAWSGTHMNE